MSDDNELTVAEAKAKLSEVIEDARTRGPQTITKHGKKAVVVVAADQWELRAQRRGTLLDFFLKSSVRGLDLKIRRRSKRQPRSPDLG